MSKTAFDSHIYMLMTVPIQMFPSLPSEIWSLIYTHVARIEAAEYIERRYRLHKFRHTQLPKWPLLLYVMRQHLNSTQLEILYNNPLIRREWRSEPWSWIYEIGVRPHNLIDIVEEVERGVWK